MPPVFSRIHPLFLGTSLLILAAYLIITLTDENQLAALLKVNRVNSKALEFLTMAHQGVVFGCVMGQTLLAAAWTSLGPLKFLNRLGLSLLWIAIVLSANIVGYFHRMLPSSGSDAYISGMILLGICIFGQWLLVQIPLWLLYIMTAARLQVPESDASALNLRYRQFGIRQLMIFTGIISLLLAIGRIIVPLIKDRMSDDNDIAVVCFVFIANSLLMLPLLLASLLTQRRLIATGISLALIAIGTAIAVPWCTQLVKYPIPQLAWFFIFSNSISALWILIVTYLARRSGYRLITASSTPNGVA